LFDGQHTLTVSDIAGSIRRTAKHEAAEIRLAGLKTRAAELHSQIRELVAERHRGSNGAEIDRALSRLFAERERIAEQAGEARREVVGLRAQHAAKVRSTLRPTIAVAAGRAHRALAELRTALEPLAALNDALIGARDGGLDLGVPGLDALATRLAVLAEKD
jgi:uncharacterized coiled-coil DUF342 family protein